MWVDIILNGDYPLSVNMTEMLLDFAAATGEKVKLLIMQLKF